MRYPGFFLIPYCGCRKIPFLISPFFSISGQNPRIMSFFYDSIGWFSGEEIGIHLACSELAFVLIIFKINKRKLR
jgi:hypothetical protein